MAVGIGAVARGQQYASLEIVVTTRDGKVYDLGCQRQGDRRSELMQDIRIAKYVRDRRKSITDPDELHVFETQIRQLKHNLKMQRKAGQ